MRTGLHEYARPARCARTVPFHFVALAERRLIQAGHFSDKRIAMIGFKGLLKQQEMDLSSHRITLEFFYSC
jgi:hypothetical protein